MAITALSHARVVGLGSPKARPPGTLTTTSAIAHSFSSWFGSSGSGCGAAVFGEELIDILLRLGFDLAVEILVVPRFLGGQVIEGVVVAGQMVPDVGTGRQRGALIHSQCLGSTHPATAHDCRVSRGCLGDLVSQLGPLGWELEKPSDRIGQFLPIGGLSSCP